MNKSFILVLAFLTVTTFVQAQTSSGNMMVGGAFQFTSVSRQANPNNSFSSFNFAPSFGYFISDNFAVGTSLNLGTSRSGTGDAKTVVSIFGFGPFARYDLPTSSENFSFFGQAGVTFSSVTENPPIGPDSKSSSFSFLLSPGAAYFFNEHWALEFSVNLFRITTNDPDNVNDNDKTTTVDFGLTTLSPSLGFRYHF